ncbi:MAG: ATP-grasp fold amidoligase family protein [Actinomycetota bacterium]
MVRRLLPDQVVAELLDIYFDVLYWLGPQYAYFKLRRKLKRPVTYSEKVRYKAVFDRDPMLTVLCDRIAVRNFVEEAIGDEFLAKSYIATSDPDSIDWKTLPREYVCKANHGCGAIIMVWEGADPELRLPTDVSSLGWARLQIHPDHADPELMTAILKYWLTLDYSWGKKRTLPEWAYKNIDRGILIEEFLHEADGAIPADYKLYVVHGEVKLIRTITGRNESQRHLLEHDVVWNQLSSTHYDSDWNELPVQISVNGKVVTPNDPPLSPPPAMKTLIDVAQALGKITDSARVDLYAIGDRVVFGEMTIYSNAGYDYFIPDWYNYHLGAEWKQIPYKSKKFGFVK